jgi:hypothetical protein
VFSVESVQSRIPKLAAVGLENSGRGESSELVAAGNDKKEIRLCQEDFKLSSVQLRVQLWSVNQRATEAEDPPLLRFVTRKR